MTSNSALIASTPGSRCGRKPNMRPKRPPRVPGASVWPRGTAMPWRAAHSASSCGEAAAPRTSVFGAAFRDNDLDLAAFAAIWLDLKEAMPLELLVGVGRRAED